METIVIKTQKQFNKLKKSYNEYTRICIICDIEIIDFNPTNSFYNIYGNAVIKYVYGNAVINNVYGNAVINNVYGNAVIKYVYGNTVIRDVYDNAVINNVYGNAVIKYVYGNTVIRDVYDNVVIKYVYGNAVINNVYGNAVIEDIHGNAIIRNVYGNTVIRDVYDNAVINNVYGNAVINNVYGNTVIRDVYDNVVIKLYGYSSILNLYSAKEIVSNGFNIIRKFGMEKIKINKNKDTKFIHIKKTIEDEPTFNVYKKLYPVEIKRNKIIMYKAVIKKDNIYYSNYNNNFIYKIGKIKKEIIKGDNSCDSGIHIAYKQWATNFGKNFDNYALLELEVDVKDIKVSSNCNGKIRASKVKVLRDITNQKN